MERKFIVHRKTYITTNLSKMYISINVEKRIHQYGCLRLEKKIMLIAKF